MRLVTEYDFRTLSPADFERLARDILNASLGLELHAYAAGRDQGIDLRQVHADGTLTVVQCKHYLDSSWATFKTAVKKEVPKGQALNADRYVFVTSRDLTPLQENDVISVLGPLGVTQESVWARKQLNAALEVHSEVERRHIKLWLSSAGVLETIIGAGRWNRAEAMLGRALKRAKLWVRTESYDAALRVLEREGVCIVYGPPGVGKSFAAETALLAATAEGWSPIHVSNGMGDAWEGLRPDSTNQIFYHDDFLGESQLRMGKNEPSDLADFIERIKDLREHKRFIMTTREQFIHEAAGEYDALQDLPEEVRQLGVRVDRPSTRTRAEILFNHLYFSAMPGAERDRMAVDNRILTVVDHPAYNPRLIERALKSWRQESMGDRLEAIKQALDTPGQLWKTSFQNLEPLGRQILLTMATLPNRPWPLDRIRRLVSLGDTLKWRPTLRILDSTWLSISGSATEKYVMLADPGCWDYLLSILDDGAVADDLVGRIQTIEQVVSLTRAAGLPAGSEGSTSRPELAHSLTSHREQLMELVRAAVAEDGGEKNASGSAQLLRDAAAMTAIYGTDPDADWLVARIEIIAESGDHLPAAGARRLFELAEILAELATADPGQRDAVAERLVLEGVRAIGTIRDLDAYERLPERLRTPEVQEATRQSASRVLSDEADHLLQDADDPHSVRLGAADIDKRSDWYGLDLDTSLLMDRANEIQEEAERQSPWPEIEADHEAGYPDGDVTSVRQIFSRFNE